MIISGLGLANSLTGPVIAYTTFALPFALWLLRSFLVGIPIDLEEAAMIDGASRMAAFVETVIPQALPGIISTALFTFILAWNEYLYALVFVNTDSSKTPPPDPHMTVRGAKSECLERAGAEILDEHVRSRHELTQHLLPRGVLQIERDRPLVGSLGKKIRPHSGAPKLGIGAGLAHLVRLPRRLHRDDVGAENGRLVSAARASEHMRAVDHPHTLKRPPLPVIPEISSLHGRSPAGRLISPHDVHRIGVGARQGNRRAPNENGIHSP